MNTTKFIQECNQDMISNTIVKQVSERCTISDIFTFIVPEDVKELSIELSDKSAEMFFTAGEIGKLIIEYISSKIDDVKLLVKGNLKEDSKRILAFAIKFFKDINIIEEVDKVKIIVKDTFDIIKILMKYGKFVASCCKTTIHKIYKYLKQEVRKGYNKAKELINKLKDNFLKFAKHTFAKLISIIYKTYATIKIRGDCEFEIEKYIVKCPNYLNKGTILETWNAVMKELETQI